MHERFVKMYVICDFAKNLLLLSFFRELCDDRFSHTKLDFAENVQ